MIARGDFGDMFFAHCDSRAGASNFAYAALKGVEAAAKALRL